MINFSVFVRRNICTEWGDGLLGIGNLGFPPSVHLPIKRGGGRLN